MSDAPIDSAPHEDEGPGLDWLLDELPTDKPGDPALWPAGAVEMVALPGFTLDEESVLVPLPSAAADGEAAAGEPIGSGEKSIRPAPRRVRLWLGARAGAGVGILGAVVLTTAAGFGGIGLPTSGGSRGGHQAAAPEAVVRAPVVMLDTTWVDRLDRSVRASQVRAHREAAALTQKRRKARAAAAERRRERNARTPPAAEVRQVSNPPVTVHTAPADPWAAVPPAVREFEPGPWNLGGSAS